MNDTIDADGDGKATSIGMSLSLIDWVATRDNRISEDPEDQEARERIENFYHHLWPNALLQGQFDSDFDGKGDEQHHHWKNKLDWLGLQYYFRAGVTAGPALFPRINATLCVEGIDVGSCAPRVEESHWVPSLNYEFNELGLFRLLNDFSSKYPHLPLVITESGLPTNNGKRRAEHIVRSLEQIHAARQQGIDIRGYYHWSLIDNLEWIHGYEPHFGLYRVDRTTYDRTPTEGALVLGEIARTRSISTEQRLQYGGLGPMSPEEE